MVQIAGAAKFARREVPDFFRRYRSAGCRIVAPAPFTPHPKKWPDHGLHAAWLGHSTVLLKIDGFTILTDPLLGERCGPLVGPVTVGLKRMVAPALTKAGLPHIDLILLSHAHFDHFDLATLRSLESRGTTIITARNTCDLLRTRRYKAVHEIGWDEHARVGPTAIRGLRVNHWGARLRTDQHRGFNGYLIETPRHRVLFGGDTAYTESFRAARSSRRLDLAVLPIGAYDPWIHVHCSPEQAWKMAAECRAEFVLPVHHQTFRLSREPYFEPVERLVDAAGNQADRIVTTRIGHEWSQS